MPLCFIGCVVIKPWLCTMKSIDKHKLFRNNRSRCYYKTHLDTRIYVFHISLILLDLGRRMLITLPGHTRSPLWDPHIPHSLNSDHRQLAWSLTHSWIRICCYFINCDEWKNLRSTQPPCWIGDETAYHWQHDEGLITSNICIQSLARSTDERNLFNR